MIFFYYNIVGKVEDPEGTANAQVSSVLWYRLLLQLDAIVGELLADRAVNASNTQWLYSKRCAQVMFYCVNRAEKTLVLLPTVVIAGKQDVAQRQPRSSSLYSSRTSVASRDDDDSSTSRSHA